MKSHLNRFALVVILTIVVVVAIALSAIFKVGTEALVALSGALAVLLPAVVDAGLVEQRRRNPTTPAIDDDVAPGSR